MRTFSLRLMRNDSEVAMMTFDLWSKRFTGKKPILEKHLLFSWQPKAWSELWCSITNVSVSRTGLFTEIK